MCEAVPLAEAQERIALLDLEPIIFKLVVPDPGEKGMALEEADRRAELYRQFLTLKLMYPDTPLVPSRAIDSVWHQHILDTVKYASDCEALFGSFLHHFPYFGLRGDTDEARWRNQSQITRQLFQQHFGADLGPTVFSECQHTGCAACQTDGSHTTRERPRPVRA